MLIEYKVIADSCEPESEQQRFIEPFINKYVSSSHCTINTYHPNIKTQKTMIATKRIVPAIGLKYISDSDVTIFTAQRIRDLTEHAAAFPGLNPSVATLAAALSEYEQAMAAVGVMGNPSATTRKNNWRKHLDYLLMQCALNCASIADSEAVYLLSGFNIKRHGTRITSLETPANLQFKLGPISGSVYASFKSVKNAGSYEVSVSQIANHESLTIVNSNKGCRLLIFDLKPLSSYYGKCRAIGTNNIKSPWTSVIKFPVV